MKYFFQGLVTLCMLVSTSINAQLLDSKETTLWLKNTNTVSANRSINEQFIGNYLVLDLASEKVQTSLAIIAEHKVGTLFLVVNLSLFLLMKPC